MTHEEKRVYLTRYLLDEAGYKNEIPESEEEQKYLLRGLMNIREPKPIGSDFLTIQDEYLQEVVEDKGVVDVESLEPIRDRLYLWRGDITRLRIDAIVNAANSGMCGCFQANHSCIDNIIHTVSGVQLRLYCSDLMTAQGYPEPTGKAKITPAYNLPCKYVIHTVGTICRGRVTARNIQELESCYRSCMEISDENGVRSIAFCCISTGVFGFPKQRGAEIAIRTVEECIAAGAKVEKVVFNVFSPEDEEYYREILQK